MHCRARVGGGLGRNAAHATLLLKIVRLKGVWLFTLEIMLNKIFTAIFLKPTDINYTDCYENLWKTGKVPQTNFLFCLICPEYSITHTPSYPG